MPKITVPKENLEGKPPVPVGKYTVRLDTFKPKKSKNAQSASVNLNAYLTIINDTNGLNDRKLVNNCNTEFPPSMYDMSHALGVQFDGEAAGDPNPQFPGEFQCRVHGPNCNSSDPENWSYIGPLAGAVGEVEVAESDNGKGGRTTKISKFYCRVPNCTAKHSESLL